MYVCMYVCMYVFMYVYIYSVFIRLYLLGCKVCGKEYVGSTFTSLRTRFNNYKSSSTKLSVAQAEIFRHFTEANHNGFLEDVTIRIIDRVFGESRLREGFLAVQIE